MEIRNSLQPWIVVGGIFLLILVAVLFLYRNPLRGVVAATHIDQHGRVAAFVLHLDRFSTTTVQYKRNVEVLNLIAAVDSPDLTKKAILYKNTDGKREIAIQTPGGSTIVDMPPGVPDVPQWSSDGLSIAFSEITSTSSDTVTDPDNWMVVRAVSAGNSLVVGNGYRPFASAGQRTFALTSRGIELLTYQNQEPNLILESPKPLTIETPFAVSESGNKIAWVAPADKSLQVFENQNGYFIPLLLKSDYNPQSIVFSPDDKYLLTAVSNNVNTNINLIRVRDGKMTQVGVLDGTVILHSWRYEK